MASKVGFLLKLLQGTLAPLGKRMAYHQTTAQLLSSFTLTEKNRLNVMTYPTWISWN